MTLVLYCFLDYKKFNINFYDKFLLYLYNKIIIYHGSQNISNIVFSHLVDIMIRNSFTK